MAEFKTTVALEVGAQSVTMGVFTPAGKGFALSRYARRDILLDPVEEGMRMDYVSDAIAQMVTELKVKGSEVRNVVSGQQVFMRFIKLPALDMSDISEQVGYEAQQHIPFPLESITYSYQVLADREDGELEVLLVAIKKDVLDSLNSQVEGSGLRTRSVDCSITSLYNAFRVSYPDETEPVMILDIGAKTTDIIFAENGRFFTRSVTAAGSFITNSIAREFNLSYREAEKLKIEQGQISMGNGHTDSMTEQEASLATVIRTAMQRLSSEVQRTINHYRMQYKGNPPVKAYICGGGARLPYVSEFLNSVLNIPVEFMNPLAAFSIGNKVDAEALEMDMLSMGAVAGAAVTGAKVGEFNIDLVPTSVGKNRAELEMLPKVCIGGAVALLGAAFFAYTANSDAKKMEAAVKEAAKPVADVKQFADNIDAAKAKFDNCSAKYAKIAELMKRRVAYSNIFKCLSQKCSSFNYWFTDFMPLTNYSVEKNLAKDAGKGSLINNDNSASTLFIVPATTEEGQSTTEVTAVMLKGYTFLNPMDADNPKAAAEGRIKKLARQTLAQTGAGTSSVFSQTTQDVDGGDSHYFKFYTADDTQNQDPPPAYAERFILVLPLKETIHIPALDPQEEK